MEDKKYKCLECGSENTSKLFLSWSDYFFSVFVLRRPYPYNFKRCKCLDCGYKFKIDIKNPEKYW